MKAKSSARSANKKVETARAKLRLGLPKGSLQDATIEKMAKAGFNVQVSSRSYVPYVDDEEMEIRLIRAQETVPVLPGDTAATLH